MVNGTPVHADITDTGGPQDVDDYDTLRPLSYNQIVRNSIFLVEFSGNVGQNIFLTSTASQKKVFGRISRNRD